MRCRRADSDSVGSRIMSDVWRLTNEAIVIIADLSGSNPNVFYEVGLAHAIGKPVILLTSDTKDIPFDVRDIRAIHYDPATGFRMLRDKLLGAIRPSIETLPEHRGTMPKRSTATPAVRVTHVQAPSRVTAGQPFEIIVHARNEGGTRREGYFSVSFPEAVDEAAIEIVETDIDQHIGRAKDPWCAGRVILQYSIAEGFASRWEPAQEHFLKVRARSHRAGWLPFFINATSQEGTGSWTFDPEPRSPHTDQRAEPVYCGILEVST